jgi:hypothetical protein
MSKDSKNNNDQENIFTDPKQGNDTQKPESYGGSNSTYIAAATRSAKSLVGCLAIAAAANRKKPNINQLMKCGVADLAETTVGIASHTAAKNYGASNDKATLVGSTARTVSGAVFTGVATTQGLSIKKKAAATFAATIAETAESVLEMGAYGASSTITNHTDKEKKHPNPSPTSPQASKTKEESHKDFLRDHHPFY